MRIHEFSGCGTTDSIEARDKNPLIGHRLIAFSRLLDESGCHNHEREFPDRSPEERPAEIAPGVTPVNFAGETAIEPEPRTGLLLMTD